HFSQPRRAGHWARAGRPPSGRCKKMFEFASKRLKTGKGLAEIAHRTSSMLQRKASLCIAKWGAGRWSQEASSQFHGALAARGKASPTTRSAPAADLRAGSERRASAQPKRPRSNRLLLCRERFSG